MKNNIVKFAALHALGTAAYVTLIASFLFYTPQIFGTNGKDTVLIPIMMLLLFVCSAAITGLLVIGRPILWYMDGKKKEGISLLISTVIALFLILLVVFSALVLSRR